MDRYLQHNIFSLDTLKMPRTFSHIIIILAWILSGLAVLFSITGGLDQIFFRPNDVQVLSLPLLASGIALWVLAAKPTWNLIQQEKLTTILSVALTGMASIVAVYVLIQIGDRMLFDFSRYAQDTSGTPDTNSTIASIAKSMAPNQTRYSVLDSYRSAASRSVLPDWWNWGSYIVWALTAVVLSSAVLKVSQSYGSVVAPTSQTKEEILKELENRIWARGFFLKARAVLALVLIFTVLAAGGSFIYNAGRLIEVETREETRLDRLRSVRSDLQGEVIQATLRLNDLKRQKLSTDLYLSSAQSLRIPDIPEIPSLTVSNNESKSPSAEALLADWTAFTSEVCQATWDNSSNLASSLRICRSSEVSSILGRHQVLSIQRDEFKQTLRNHSRDLMLELTGADGRVAGEGSLARAAREGIEQFQSLLADLNLEFISLEQELAIARKSVETVISSTLREAIDQRDLTVFFVLRSTLLRSISGFETEAGFLSDAIDQISNDTAGKLTAINKLDETISTDIERVFPEEVKGGPDWPTLMATALTRISILLILVFLVQILVGLYRYSLRLAAFYDARADTLSLGHVDEESFAKWADVLSPQDIDFGRNPTSPSQHLENMITKALDRRKKNDDTEPKEEGK